MMFLLVEFLAEDCVLRRDKKFLLFLIKSKTLCCSFLSAFNPEIRLG